jgi:alpha-glucosidase
MLGRVIATDHYLRFERATDVTETATGVQAATHGEHLRIDLVRPDTVRFAISRGGRFDERPTFAVCVDPLAGPPAFEVERAEGLVRLRTSVMVVSLWLEPLRFDVHRLDGTPVVETAQDDEGRYWAYATLNDAFTVRRRSGHGDAFYGLGEKTGGHNRQGRDFTLWNTDVLSPDATGEFTAGREGDDPRSDPTSTEFDPYYVSIPFFYHHRYPRGLTAGSFMDNAHRADYDFTRPGEHRIQFAGGQYTEYVFAGPLIPDILEAYTWLTGRMSPPPLWSLGYHQCRWFDYTQDAVEALAERHRKDRIPCDALWLDIEYMDGYRVFTWDEEKFPDRAGMLKRLADKGFRVITIIDPGVKHDPGYWVYDQALAEGLLCRTEGGDVYVGQVWPGDTAFPDFATEEARQWWGELNAAHVRSGLAGIWNDMNEPATGSIDPSRMRFNRGTESHDRYHNQYALLMAMGTTQGLRAAMPDLRPFVLSRAGFAGIQRYAANWMGDNVSNWEHLWLSMPMAAGFGLSGQAFVGADIGGFAGNSNAELYLRWMQYGALTPFCRNHSAIGNVDQYAWAFGDVVRDVVRSALELRYRLLPYIYGAFLRAAETGAPVQRPLVFDYQQDATVWDLDDEYLFGPDLLVAPVTQSGQTARQVYLPDGEWHDWATGERHPGRSFVIVPTPVERIPIFARGGAVIPMWESAPASTAAHFPDVLELHVFVPSGDGEHTSVVQEDDGVTLKASGDARVRTALTLRREGSSLTLAGTAHGNGFPEFSRERLRLVLHGSAASAAQADGADVPVTDGRIEFGNAGEAFSVRISLAD